MQVDYTIPIADQINELSLETDLRSSDLCKFIYLGKTTYQVLLHQLDPTFETPMAEEDEIPETILGLKLLRVLSEHHLAVS